jgi:hypothetical protein
VPNAFIRCAIMEVRYSFNAATLDKNIDMPPCNEKDPPAIPRDYQPYFRTGKEVSSKAV